MKVADALTMLLQFSAIMGVVVWARGRRAHSRHGPLIILVSLLAAGAWAVVIASGALTTTNSGF